MKEITNSTELKALLSARDPRRYVSTVNTINLIGNPWILQTEIKGYVSGNDLMLVEKTCLDGIGLYFEVSDKENIGLFYDAVQEQLSAAKMRMFSSDSPDIFENPVFIRKFGKHPFDMKVQYGMFSACERPEGVCNIRRLTSDDEAVICAFQEPIYSYRNNLRNAVDKQIKTDDKKARVYGYFCNGEILGYLIAFTFGNGYWDIDYLHVSEKARRKGIGKQLARYYASDIMENGGFACYGTPVNEASKRLAEAAGFVEFERLYFTNWVE